MEVRANMAGVVQEIKVTAGDRVESGQELVVIESMKMQIPIPTPAAGIVKTVRIHVGEFVNEGDPLLDIE